MLLSLNSPFSDVRRFISQDIDYLKEPLWAKQGSSSFVPYFGTVERRKRDHINGIEIFGNENEVSDIRKSIGFHKTIQLLDNQASRCLSRRLWFDEQSVGFFEIIIDTTQGKKEDLKTEQVERMLKRFLTLQVAIINSKDKEHNPYVCELYQANQYLAKLFETATKNIFLGKDFSEIMEGCVVKPCVPILFLEYDFREEIIQVPYWIKSISSPKKPDLRIHYSFLPCDQSFIRIWLLGSSSQESVTSLKKLQSALLNIHIEHECLRSVLKDIARGRIEILSRSKQSNVLQHYLSDSIQRINLLEDEITKELGVDFPDYSLEYTDPLRSRDKRWLLDKVGVIDLRRNIFDKLEKYIEDWSRIPVYPQCYFCNRDCSYETNSIAQQNKNKQIRYDTFLQVRQGAINMYGNESIHIDNQGTLSGVIGSSISNSSVTNAINQLPTIPAKDQPDIKTLLTQLQEAIHMDNTLTIDDKNDALEQVEALAKISLHNKPEEKLNLARKAIRSLNRIITNIPNITTIIETVGKVFALT